MGGATVIANGSDDGLLAHFVDPALGCTPFIATDTTSPNGMDSSQALNALSARRNQAATRALLPVNDPQLLVAGQFSIGKTNTYRMETDQPLLARNANKNQNAAAVLPEHGQHPAGQAPAGHGEGSQLHHPGAGDRQQPGHVHGSAAVCLVHAT